mmetsp:Transcript_10727/g.12953  ORF Transcript_10727/g.12953 Transcript_10727/m.12953 type:complete len:166 (-) Transcript_10727:25-522(-)
MIVSSESASFLLMDRFFFFFFRNIHKSLQHCAIKCISCETITTAPPKSLMPFERASILSRSKWFVGSSKTTKLGSERVSRARTTLLFCPPDRVSIFCNCCFPVRENLPSQPLASTSLKVPLDSCLARCIKASTAVSFLSSFSISFCEKYPMFLTFERISPSSRGS